MEVTSRLAAAVGSSGARVGRRKWVALPFTDYCPPVVSDSANLSEVAVALDAARREKCIPRFEVRAGLDIAESYAPVVAVRHTLELNSQPEVVFRTFNRSQTQRNIRKAQREGVVALRRGTSMQDLTRVYFDLHLETRRRQGVPTQPRRFFEHLWRELLEPGHGFLLLASADGRPIAGGVFLTWKDTVVYKFGASSSRFWSLRPNNLLFWEAIRWSCEQGFRVFDFGRTDLANRGLRNFKDNWGTQESPLRYSVISDAAPKSLGPTLPRPVSAVIRMSPTWLSRMLGELLYRVAA
jgi:CelD/BcsL family acetyltransferase involved in cellulose biosynthesis